MTKFKHILITRFNLPQRWDLDKKGNVVLDTIWLRDRFNLFQNFCLPSINGQTSKTFEWWVYFDVNTENEFKKAIENMEDKYPYFQAKYEKSYDSFEANMPKEIHDYLKNENIGWLITTRLDNDDMLAKNTVEIIQKKINFQKDTILEIPRGYTLELKETSKLRIVNYTLNPFISYVEKIKNEGVVKSVYFYEHAKWRDVERTIVTNTPQWIQIIHEKNLSNRALGELVFPFIINSRFNYNKKAIKMNVSFNYLTSIIVRRFRKLEILDRSINKIKLLFK